MNNEIKEILDKLKNHIEHIRFANLTNYELRLLYDYITNLQEDLKYQKEMEEEYNKKHTKLMQDYSKLQKENDRLAIELNNQMIERNQFLSRIDKAIPMLKELNIKIKEILKIGIDIKEISDIEEVLRGEDKK